MKHTRCPNCRQTDFKDFFTIPEAPIHSLVTIKDYEEAISIPKKEITLAFCNHCGFIFNSSFDTSLDYYTKGYEDQQGFSQTFIKFITGVTQRFIDRYDLIQKEVVEIGCGKGDFINLISELGDNRGIGIDPAWVPGRTKESPNVKFIREFYSEAHGDLKADCIVCRHTLEHIHDTYRFMDTIRRSLRENENVILFFEVPSIIRILKIQAFWDIFYEHCTYMSPGSIARLFRLTGFEILDMYLEYDDQYLFVEARPVNGISKKIHILEESVEELRALTESFIEKISIQLSTWREKLITFKNSDKKVVIWGGGSKSVGFLTQFHDIGVIRHVVDINPHMQSNYIPGIGIQYVAPEFLKNYQPDVVIIMNSIYLEEIRQKLISMGVNPEIYGL